MKIIILSLAVIAALQAVGQTKKIAHRSHSGSNTSLDVDSEDDFGLPPEYKEKQRQKMDSAAKYKAMVKDSMSAKQTATPAKSKTKAAPIRKTKKAPVSH